MRKFMVMSLTMVMLGLGNFGCVGRLISEGAGTVIGASGKVVYIARSRDLHQYKGLTIESLVVSPGLPTPGNVTMLVRQQIVDEIDKRGLKATGQPGLKLRAEIIHYETGGVVDTAIGPLEEMVVRTKLIDAQSGAVLTEANLIGRSKATTSSGPENLARGVGRALDRWLEECGLKKPG